MWRLQWLLPRAWCQLGALPRSSSSCPPGAAVTEESQASELASSPPLPRAGASQASVEVQEAGRAACAPVREVRGRGEEAGARQRGGNRVTRGSRIIQGHSPSNPLASPRCPRLPPVVPLSPAPLSVSANPTPQRPWLSQPPPTTCFLWAQDVTTTGLAAPLNPL